VVMLLFPHMMYLHSRNQSLTVEYVNQPPLGAEDTDIYTGTEIVWEWE
jgi:hypothetical protein